MIKFINILSSLISEQKKYVMEPELYSQLVSLTEKLWKFRNKKITGKTEVGVIRFQTLDGTEGMIRVFLNPRLSYIGLMDTKPKFSRDPMDFVMDLQPKKYESKKNLFLTIYHEVLHALDPTQSTKTNMKYFSTYNPKVDKFYWGHPIEFFAITNEFLESLELEFKRRVKKIKVKENKKFLIKSLDNIVNHFGKNEPLSKLSLDIISRMNDEGVIDNIISKKIVDIQTEFPNTAEIFKKKDEPYFLTYINLIKENNPKIWPRFLTMLYKTSQDIKKDIIES